MARTLSRLCTLSLLLAAAPAQDGLGLAYYYHSLGGRGNRVALAPDVAVERILADVLWTLAKVSERRAKLLEWVPDQHRQAVTLVRDEVLANPREFRRGYMRMLNPEAFCEIWPRGPDTELEVLAERRQPRRRLRRRETDAALVEVEWFARRHGRAAEPASFDAFEQFGIAVWGPRASAERGGAPYADLPDERAAFLAALDHDVEGVVPRLLQALGDSEPALGPAAERRALWLEVMRDWRVGTGCAGHLYRAPDTTILTDNEVHVLGSPEEWEASADACERWHEALLLLTKSGWPQVATGSLSNDAKGLQFLCLTAAEAARSHPTGRLTRRQRHAASCFTQNLDMLAGSTNDDRSQRIGVEAIPIKIAGETTCAFVLTRR